MKLRLGIGYVIQNAGLMPHQRVIDNVATVPVLRGQPRRAARKAAYEVLERVGLDAKLATRYPAQLSGGEQQRVGVARALAADPPILLMDEPFSAVDPVVRHELQNEILRLQSELHKTIVFVTHDIDEALKLADQVAVFGRGGVLQQYDEPARLLSRPANDFVAKFIGLGRGYRWLQLIDASGLPLHDIDRISVEQPFRWRAHVADGWTLVVDDDVPLGWIDADGARRHRAWRAAVRQHHAPSVRSFDRAETSARRSMRPCPRRRRWASPLTATARSSAAYWPPTCWPPWKRAGRVDRALSADAPRQRLGADRGASAAVAAAGADRAGDRGAAGRAGAARADRATADDDQRPVSCSPSRRWHCSWCCR